MASQEIDPSKKESIGVETRQSAAMFMVQVHEVIMKHAVPEGETPIGDVYTPVVSLSFFAGDFEAPIRAAATYGENESEQGDSFFSLEQARIEYIPDPALPKVHRLVVVSRRSGNKDELVVEKSEHDDLKNLRLGRDYLGVIDRGLQAKPSPQKPQ